MGLNLYGSRFTMGIETEEHIGKKSGNRFIWAIDPDLLSELEVVKDEYGKQYTLRQLMSIFTENTEHDYELIGREFS